jgi:DNA-binding MarR family transcriptional regulator
LDALLKSSMFRAALSAHQGQAALSGLTIQLSYFTIYAMKGKQRHTVDLSWKFHRILNKFKRLESAAIKLGSDLSITHKEVHAIQAIGEIDDINITQLGNHFGFTKSAASQLVSKLEKKGLVGKKPALHSAKELRLTLTELGWQAYELHEEHHDKNIREIARRLAPFSVTQIATTSKILGVIEGVMDERLNK